MASRSARSHLAQHLHPPSGTVSRIAIDPASDIYYVGTSIGAVFAGYGRHWLCADPSEPAGAPAVTDIEVDPSEEATIYASFKAAGDGRIIRATRVNAIYQVLDITGNLPADLSVRSLAVDRMNRHTIYAGTDQGVYRGRMTSAMPAWEWDLYSNGLPAPDVQALRAHPISGVLYAATLGRGVYEVNTAPSPGSDWLPAIMHMTLST